MQHRLKVTILIGLLLILPLGSMFSIDQSRLQVRAVTIFYVGPNENHTEIQDAIDAAQPGDEVFVYNGEYHEHLEIKKSITLRGEDKRSTKINGSNYNGDGIIIAANNVNLNGFTITSCGFTWGEAGVKLIGAEHCNITDNIIRSNLFNGIRLIFSNNTIISNNTIYNNNESGIFLDKSNRNIISNNEIFPGNSIGISIGFSNDNSIINNKISESKLLGIDTWEAMNNIYKNNDFLKNKGNAIEFWNANSNFFENNNVTKNGGDGIQLQSSRSNTFRNNRLEEDGFSFGGLKVTHWNSHAIDETNFVNNKPVYYKKNHQGGSVATGAGQVILANCTMVTVKDQVISKTSEGIILGFSSFNTITNNKVSSNSRYGITVWKSNDNTFSNNELAENGEVGIYIWDSNKNTLEENNIKNHQIAIELRSARNHKLKDNVMVDNSVYITGNYLFDFWRDVYPDRITDDKDNVIWVYSDAYWTTHTIDTSNTVNGNPIQYWKNQEGGTVPTGAGQVILAKCSNVTVENQNISSGLIGIQLGFSSGNLINNNSLTSNQWHGIYLESSDQNRIMNNHLTANKKQGILFDSSNRNILTNNQIQNNDESGVFLYFSDNNTFSDNLISNNYLGIELDGYSYDNIIFHNDFIDNDDQAIDYGRNIWNSSYPDGGNYWSQYMGIDNRSGIEQDKNGSDGLSDSPFNLPISWYDAVDWYPLMEPWLGRTHPPNEPLNLHAMAGDGYVLITWDKPQSDGGIEITNYKIYRGTDRVEPSYLITLDNILVFNDTFVTNGETYYYRISAVNPEGEGPNSTDISAIPEAIPSNGDDGEDGNLFFILLGVVIIIIWLILMFIVFRIMRKRVIQTVKTDQDESKNKEKKEHILNGKGNGKGKELKK